MKPGKREIIDRHGFLNLSPGTRLTFLMTAETLDYVDRAGEALHMDRPRVLMSTTVSGKIDPNVPIFIQVGPAEIDDPNHPLTFAGSAGSNFTLISTEDRGAIRPMPEGSEFVTVSFRLRPKRRTERGSDGPPSHRGGLAPLPQRAARRPVAQVHRGELELSPVHQAGPAAQRSCAAGRRALEPSGAR
jgi:hypothetical protein